MKHNSQRSKSLTMLSVLMTSLALQAVGPIYSAVDASTGKDARTESVADQMSKGLRQHDQATKALAQKSWYNGVKEQLKAQGVDVAKLDSDAVKNQTVKVIVQLSAKPAVDKTAKPTGSVASVKKITAAEDDVVDGQSSVLKQVEKITGTKASSQFGYLLNGFAIKAKVSQLDQLEGLKGVASVAPTASYHLLEASSNQQAKVQTAVQNFNNQNYNLDGRGTVIGIIDSGVDPSHKDLKLSPEGVKAEKITKSVAQEKIKALGHGEWYSDKVPYAYNYMEADSGQDTKFDNSKAAGGGNSADNDKDNQDTSNAVRDTGQTMHGMHVSGIAAANGDIAADDTKTVTAVKGVAPEAQILDLKVFANSEGGNGNNDTDAIVQSIEDAVTLGADVINMSLGRNGGADGEGLSSLDVQAVNAAAEAGTLPVISAGNSGVSNSGAYGSPASVQWAQQDNGIVGDPGVANNALTVASAENTMLVTDVMDFSRDGEENPFANEVVASVAHLQFGAFPSKKQIVVLPNKHGAKVPDNTPELVGLGYPDDYDGLDVKGKIVLLARGELNFSTKQQTALDKGAAGFIIMNNVPGTSFNGNIDNSADIPSVGLSYEDGVALKKEVEAGGKKDTYSFSAPFKKRVTNPAGGTPSDFTSWGPSPTLQLKPEISGPGGHIWSLANDDKYQNMSGTSMSSPFVAGSEALILEAMHERGTTLKGGDLTAAAKLAAINTSEPMVDKAGVPYSPRRQGSGMINVNRAISTDVQLTYDGDNTGVVSLKEIDKKTTFSVTLKNNGKQAVSYKLNGDYKPEAQYLRAGNGGQEQYAKYLDGAKLTATANKFTVAPGDSKKVTFTLDLSDAQNGKFDLDQFVEGYIGFDALDADGNVVTPRADDNSDKEPTAFANGVNLTIPYLGFYGNWGGLDALDAPAFDGDKSHYQENYLRDGYSQAPLGLDVPVSALTELEQNSAISQADEPAFINPNHVAISPDGDGYQDSAVAFLAYLRNVKATDVTIEDAKGNTVRDLKKLGGWSRAYINEVGQATIYQDQQLIWDGKVSNSSWSTTATDAPDGQYYYTIKSTPYGKNAKPQTLKLPVKVDTTAPTVTNVDLKQENGAWHVTGHVADNVSGFESFTNVAVAINNVIEYYQATDNTGKHFLGLGDEDKGNQKSVEDNGDFDFAVTAEQARAITNGTNDVQGQVEDIAGNIGTYHTRVAGSEDIFNTANDILLYNVTNNQIATDADAYYDAKTKTYTVYGYSPQDLYLTTNDAAAGAKVAAKINKYGEFTAKVPVTDKTRKLIFKLDDARTLKTTNFSFSTSPTVQIDKKDGALTDNGAGTSYYLVNHPLAAGNQYTFSGSLSKDADGIAYNAISYDEDDNMNQNGEEVDEPYKGANTDATESVVYSQYGLELHDDGRWNLAAKLAEGQNILYASAYKFTGQTNQDKIYGPMDYLFVNQPASTYLNFKNVVDFDYTRIDASKKDYDAKTGIYTVKGEWDPATKVNVQINVNGQVDKDGKTDWQDVTKQDDGTFTFPVKVGDNSSKRVHYRWTAEVNGKTIGDEGYFVLYTDALSPYLKLDGNYAKSSDPDYDYEVWTNKKDFTISGEANDNMAGYDININADDVAQDKRALDQTYEHKNVEPNLKFSKTYELFKTPYGKDDVYDHIFQVGVYDIHQNGTKAKILVHYAPDKKVARPTVKADTTKPAKAVKLSVVSNEKDVTNYYSLDSGKTWNQYNDAINIAFNSTPEFKSVDKYGNESAVVKHAVTNAVYKVAADATVKLGQLDKKKGQLTVTLGYTQALTASEKTYTYLEYSTNKGKSWKKYTSAVTFKKTTNLQVRTADSLGHKGQVKTATVTVPTVKAIKKATKAKKVSKKSSLKVAKVKTKAKKVTGKAAKKSVVTVYNAKGKKLGTAKANAKGKFTVKLKKALKKNQKIKVKADRPDTTKIIYKAVTKTVKAK
ncbi:hypothetical protein EQG49_07275 [Periweissella cryptocerci]|uniref:Peptidase S8 n=1 Tax=Periweissella cryptocerci TaxID=2506420 RepID=A0A4P6YU85_9LACO|nr:S8 family serine peptidase [Periweissella cryptocerci]QBO36276.1 hypothetical protein EQG49_07275 [Periweissella cryptocerci]